MATADRKSIQEQIEKLAAQLKELDEQRLNEVRQAAGELGYDLVPRGSVKRGRRAKAPGEGRTYNISPESKVSRKFKHSHTIGLRTMSEAEAVKKAHADASALAKELGVTYDRKAMESAAK